MTKSITSILLATLFATTLGFAQDTESLLDLARGEAAKAGSTPASVAAATKARAIESGLSEDDANYEASKAVARAIAEKEYEEGSDAAKAGVQGVIAGTILHQGKSYSEVPVDSMGNAIAEGVAEKALEKGKAPADVAQETKLSAVSAGVDEELAKGMAGYIASREVTKKALDNGESAADAAVKARQAVEGAGYDSDIAKQLAADVATEEVTERSVAKGDSIAETSAKARQAAEGAGLDSETAKVKAADIATDKVTEKALSQGDSVTEVAAKARQAAEGAGLDSESAKQRAADVAATKVTEKAISQGDNAAEVAAKARQAAEAAGLDSETAREKAADIAVEKVTEKALADGDSIADSAAKAREAAEGAGLDAETAKDRAADVAADKVAEKAIADGKSAAEAGAEALAAAKAAGVSDERAKEKAGTRAADIAADEAISKGLSEEEARDRAKAAAEAAGFNATDAEQIATDAASDAKDAYRPFEGNRTPVVQNVQAAQIEGTKLLRITYDLKVADDFPCNITIRWSTDNGASFPLTATAVTGAVGPGVMQGENLEVIWDMAVDWDNKFTDEGQVEIIASRIPTSGGDGRDEIIAPSASWSLANNDQDLVITTTSLSTEDLTKIVTAIDDENLLWVDTVFPSGDNGDERAIWHNTDEPNHSLKITGNTLVLTVKHTSALNAANFNLLDVAGIDTDSSDGVSAPITLADLPAAGTQTLRMIFALDSDEDSDSETQPEVPDAGGDDENDGVSPPPTQPEPPQ